MSRRAEEASTGTPSKGPAPLVVPISGDETDDEIHDMALKVGAEMNRRFADSTENATSTPTPPGILDPFQPGTGLDSLDKVDVRADPTADGEWDFTGYTWDEKSQSMAPPEGT